MTYIPGLWPFVLASIIYCAQAGYSWRFRKKETGRYFFLQTICALLWVGLFVFETASNSLQTKIIIVYIEFLGIIFLPVVWLFLILAYTGIILPLKQKIFLLILPAINLLVVWTNPLHHWFIGSPQIMHNLAPFPVLNLDYQFWFYYIHAPLTYLYLFTAIVILIRMMVKMDKTHQLQSSFILLALILPAIVDVLYFFGVSPYPYFNYSTAVFSISGMILIWTLFRFQFLDLLPIARDTLVDNLEDGIIVFDQKKRLAHINPAATSQYSLSQQMIGKTIEETKNSFLVKLNPLLQKNKSEEDIQLCEDDCKHYHTQAIPLYTQQKFHIGWVVSSHDVTERTKIFKQVQELSIRDNLTHVFNRRHFFELGNRELLRIQRSQNASATVVMIDLDHFKEVNDRYGHAAGDQTLIAFTETIHAQLRKYDIFGRIGGEEFTLLLNDVTAIKALTIVERLRTSVAAMRVPCHDQTISITASFGLVSSKILDKNDLTIEKMLKFADDALYEAKKQGRNCTVNYTHTD